MSSASQLPPSVARPTGPLPHGETLEWLEADGLGGYASGTASLIRTRRYHALLLAARTPPTARYALVNALECWLSSPDPDAPRIPITRHRYGFGTLSPSDAAPIIEFAPDPWPRWRIALTDALTIECDLFVPRGLAAVALTYRLISSLHTRPDYTLNVRPLMSCRDHHALHHENDSFNFEPILVEGKGAQGDRLHWHPYGDATPGIVAQSSGDYIHDPLWYRNFFYSEDAARGQDCHEDLASPGIFTHDLSTGPAAMVFEAIDPRLPHPSCVSASTTVDLWRAAELRRRKNHDGLTRAASAYIVQRVNPTAPASSSTAPTTQRSIIAGYPWFTDWGRDTFIALRGLCLATGQFDDARAILLGWAATIDQGQIPNRFVDDDAQPEFNSVDASLWFVIAAGDFLARVRSDPRLCTPLERTTLESAILSIVRGYRDGTRFNIGMDTRDGLIRAGQAGYALTWMDARIGTWCITPRIGKPCEIQALWINALAIAETIDQEGGKQWGTWRTRATESFNTRFWNPAAKCLFDVVDLNFIDGATDDAIRPNQLFAIGGLPLVLLPLDRARAVLDAAHAHLWTPMGPRSLAPSHPSYRPRYEGNLESRDVAYHQGTVWPWLSGAFIEAWLRVHASGETSPAKILALKNHAREHFLRPLLSAMHSAGLGHLAEIADAESPHTPRGCLFQAWSMGEILRLDRHVLKP
jgi:predicted glycogen debranching enzyme